MDQLTHFPCRKGCFAYLGDMIYTTIHIEPCVYFELTGSCIRSSQKEIPPLFKGEPSIIPSMGSTYAY